MARSSVRPEGRINLYSTSLTHPQTPDRNHHDPLAHHTEYNIKLSAPSRTEPTPVRIARAVLNTSASQNLIAPGFVTDTMRIGVHPFPQQSAHSSSSSRDTDPAGSVEVDGVATTGYVDLRWTFGDARALSAAPERFYVVAQKDPAFEVILGRPFAAGVASAELDRFYVGE